MVKKRDIHDIAGQKDVVLISCLKRRGLETLEDTIYNKILGGEAPTSHESLLGNVRHKGAVDRAIRSLNNAESGVRKGDAAECVSSDMRESVRSLSEIIGDVYTDDILGIVFSKFCIGK